MSDFIPVAKTSDFSDPDKKLIEVDDRLVVLVKLNGRYYCIDDVCTHDGGTLYEGQIVDTAIQCPRHGACFDLENGAALTMPATEPTAAHEVMVQGDDILIRIRDPEPETNAE